MFGLQIYKWMFMPNSINYTKMSILTWFRLLKFRSICVEFISSYFPFLVRIVLFWYFIGLIYWQKYYYIIFIGFIWIETPLECFNPRIQNHRMAFITRENFAAYRCVMQYAVLTRVKYPLRTVYYSSHIHSSTMSYLFKFIFNMSRATPHFYHVMIYFSTIKNHTARFCIIYDLRQKLIHNLTSLHVT